MPYPYIVYVVNLKLQARHASNSVTRYPSKPRQYHFRDPRDCMLWGLQQSEEPLGDPYNEDNTIWDATAILEMRLSAQQEIWQRLSPALSKNFNLTLYLDFGLDGYDVLTKIQGSVYYTRKASRWPCVALSPDHGQPGGVSEGSQCQGCISIVRAGAMVLTCIGLLGPECSM